MAKRRIFEVALPCAHCRKDMKFDIHRFILHKHSGKKRAGYWPDKSSSKKEVKCASCGTVNEVMFMALVTER